MTHFAPLETVQLGDVSITHLPDGGGYLGATALLPPSTDDDWTPYRDWLDDEGRLYISIGGLLIQTPTHKIIVDPGTGPGRQEFPGLGYWDGGDFLTSLDAVGVRPEEIDIVTWTHLHVDHIGWVVHADRAAHELVFPNARHTVMDREWDHWLRTDDPLRAAVVPVQEALADRIELVAAGAELASGVLAVGSPGHTPGHTSVTVVSGDERVMFLGDALHSGAQITQCGWHCVGDADPGQAISTRKELVRELLEAGTFAIGAHFPNTVFGHVVDGPGGPRWVEGRP
jgi:glyoxylase-like metal-dependent hydrolase (beta-lactamase superfamily II)